MQDFSIDGLQAKPPDCSCHNSPFKHYRWPRTYKVNNIDDPELTRSMQHYHVIVSLLINLDFFLNWFCLFWFASASTISNEYHTCGVLFFTGSLSWANDSSVIVVICHLKSRDISKSCIGRIGVDQSEQKWILTELSRIDLVIVSTSKSNVKKFYLKSVHEATYNISSE